MLLTIVVLTIIGFFWVLMAFSFTLRNFCGARVSSLGSGNGVLNDEGWFKGFCGRSRSGGGKEKPGYKCDSESGSDACTADVSARYSPYERYNRLYCSAYIVAIVPSTTSVVEGTIFLLCIVLRGKP